MFLDLGDISVGVPEALPHFEVILIELQNPEFSEIGHHIMGKD